MTELTGLPKGERDPERRLTHRNGYRERRWDTRVGTIPLDVPRVRDGGYLPSLLDPRRRTERALLAVVQEAYVLGVSTRRVDDLVRALGIEGISRSEVSRICAGLDAEVAAFRARPLGELACPVPLARRHVPAGPRGRPRRVDGGPRRGRGRGQRRAAGARTRAVSGQRRGIGLAPVRPLARRARPPWRPPRHQRRPPGSREGRPRAAPRLRAGNAVGSTSPATPRISCRARRGAWSRAPSARSSSSPTRARRATSSTG